MSYGLHDIAGEMVELCDDTGSREVAGAVVSPRADVRSGFWAPRVPQREPRPRGPVVVDVL